MSTNGFGQLIKKKILHFVLARLHPANPIERQKSLVSSFLIFGPVHVCVPEQTKPWSRQWEFPLKSESARERKVQNKQLDRSTTHKVSSGHALGQVGGFGSLFWDCNSFLSTNFWFESDLVRHHGGGGSFCKWRRWKKLFKSWVENVPQPAFQITSCTFYAWKVILRQRAVISAGCFL